MPIFPDDRNTTWNPGLMSIGGIPTRNTISATLLAATYGNGATDASAAIQAAIDACPSGQVVYLGGGNWKVNNLLLIWKPITLRGAGAGVTILTKTNGAHARTSPFVPVDPGTYSYDAAPMIVVGPQRWNHTDETTARALTSDGAKDATTITVSSATGYAAGQYVVIDELSGASWQDTPTGFPGNAKVWKGDRVAWNMHWPVQQYQDDNPFSDAVGPYQTGGGAGAVSLVQSKSNSNQNTTPTVTLDSTPAAGNLIVLTLNINGGGGGTVTVVPTGFSLAHSGVDAGGETVAIYYKVAVGTESALTFTLSAMDWWSIAAIEFTGNATSSLIPTGGTAGRQHNATATPSSGPTTAVAASGDLVIGAIGSSSFSGTPAAGSGFTGIVASPASTLVYGTAFGMQGMVEYRTSVAGTADSSFAAGSTSNYYVATVIFKAGLGGTRTKPDAMSWFCREDRPTGEVKEIASVSGNDITFTSPLHISYRTTHTAQISRCTGAETPISLAGVENLTTIGGADGQIRFTNAAYSWAKNVEVTQWIGEGFAVDRSFRVEIRDSYIHDGSWPEPGGAGYALSLTFSSAELLFENNISINTCKEMVSRCSGAGSVIAYNYCDDAWDFDTPTWVEVGLNFSHMSGPHHVLFEGNYSHNFDSDYTHGNAIYMTVFRNWLSGQRRSFTDSANVRVVGLAYGSWWDTFIGNVLGRPAQMAGWTYESPAMAGGNANWGSKDVWRLGYDPERWNSYADPDTLSTVIRDGNYDYLQNTTTWHTTPATFTIPNSLYLSVKPNFFGANAWPWVNPLTGATTVLPAKARYDAGTPNVVPGGGGGGGGSAVAVKTILARQRRG